MAVSSVSSTSNYYTQAAATGPVSIATALAAIKANSRTKVSISDTTDNISRNLETLRKLAGNINQVTQSDPTSTLAVSASQWAKLGSLLGKFSTDYRLQVSDVSAAAAASAASNAHVASFTVTDTSANIGARLASLSGQDKLTGIQTTTPTALISVTAAQLADSTTTLAKVKGNYGLAVTQASAEQAVGYASDLRIKSVSILDTAAAVSDQLDELQALGLRLKEIRGSDTNVFAVTADQIQTDALVIGKIYKGFQLSVIGSTMDQAQSLVRNTKVVSVDIQDTAANVSRNLALLKRLGTDLHSIHITDAKDSPLSMRSADYGAYAQVLDKISADDDYAVSITDASVSEAQTLLDNSRVSSIRVADSSMAIASSLEALQANTKLTDIVQTGKPAALALTYAQLAAGGDTLNKIRGNYSLNVSGVAAGDALELARGNSRITALSVSDSGEGILAKLQDLAALGKRLTTITQTDSDTALTLSAAQWSSQIGTLSKISGGYSVALTGVSASMAPKLMADSRVRSVAVSDTAAAIASQLDNLHSLGAQLDSITQTDTGAISVTARQWANSASTLAKLGSGYALSVRDVRAAQISSLAADSKVSAVAITDTSSNIASQLDAIQAAIDGNEDLSLSVRQIGTASPMAITASQFVNDQAALNLIAGNYSLEVSGVSAAQAGTVGANGKVTGMTVSDDGTALTSQLASLASLGGKVKRIEQTDAGTALALTATQWSTYSGLLGKVSGGVLANISDVKASGASALRADDRVASVSVSDSAAQISAHLDSLQGLGPLLTRIAQSDSDPISVSMAQLDSAASTLDKLGSDYTLAVRGASASDAQALLDDRYSHVTSVAVSDTSANIARQLDALQDNSKLGSIAQTGAAAPLSISLAQLERNADALGKIQGSYSVAIQDATAADVGRLSANSRVSGMVVKDTAQAIVGQLADLRAAGAKVRSIELAQTPATLEMSQAQWQAHQSTLAKIAQNYSVSLSQVSASQASLAASDPRVASLSVSDSMARIGANLDALQALGPKLGAITPTDSASTSLTLSAARYRADAAALAKINSDSYTLSVTAASVADLPTLAADSRIGRIAVLDEGNNIAAGLASFSGLSQLSTITVSNPAQPMAISASLWANSSATLAKIQGSYSLDIDGASAAQAAGLQADTHVSSFTLSDSTSAVNAVFGTLGSMDKLGGISLTGNDGPITLTADQLDAQADTLALIGGDHDLKVTGVSMANLSTVLATPAVRSVELSASSQDISARFDGLVALGDTLSQLQVSSPSTPIALTATQYAQGATTLAKIDGTYSLALVDVLAENAADLSNQAHVASVSVSDTADHISALFDALGQLGDALDSLEVTDDNPLLLTQAQFDAGTSLLDKMAGPVDVQITG